MIKNKKEYILYYPKHSLTLIDDSITDLLTPKEYGQKLLNRKRGKK